MKSSAAAGCAIQLHILLYSNLYWGNFSEIHIDLNGMLKCRADLG